MVDTARYFMDFIQDESCGKCVACRVGTKRMLEILERITRGEGQEGDVELLVELGNTIKETAMCGLGQTAPNPVLSTIRYFREEYDEHIRNKYCRAGVCSELFISPCENACPANVNVPGLHRPRGSRPVYGRLPPDSPGKPLPRHLRQNLHASLRDEVPPQNDRRSVGHSRPQAFRFRLCV